MFIVWTITAKGDAYFSALKDKAQALTAALSDYKSGLYTSVYVEHNGEIILTF